MEPSFAQQIGFASWESFAVTMTVIHLLDAAVVWLVARNRGRDPRLWFGLGVIGGVLALAAILLLPAPKAYGEKMWRKDAPPPAA